MSYSEEEKWYKLDNAAKIFPAVTSDNRSNTFRISCYLTENINPQFLQHALEITLPRYPSLNVRLRRGIFWYFFDTNTNKPIIYKETAYLLSRIMPNENNGYLFKISYFNNRITLEMFHALSDGGGAMEFIKTLLYQYLELKGYSIKTEGLVRPAGSPVILRELEDSFVKNSEKSSLAGLKEEKAYHLEGIPFINHGVGVIMGEMDAGKMKALAKSKDASITEFLVATYMKSVYETQIKFKKSAKPLVIFIPVNLRKFFSSESLRNFSSFIRVKVDLKSQPDFTFDELLQTVKEQMSKQLTKDAIIKKLSATVSAEKLWIFRILPLFIKKFALKIGYKVFGESVMTTSISNLGKVVLPESMMQYVKKMDFSMGATNECRINSAIGTYNDKMIISFTRTITQTDIITHFFRQLSSQGLEILVSGNNWEDDIHEIIETQKRNDYINLRNERLKKYRAMKKKMNKHENTIASEQLKQVKRLNREALKKERNINKIDLKNYKKNNKQDLKK